ncbi:unnamed protein product [Jaminaea pallidilutea]
MSRPAASPSSSSRATPSTSDVPSPRASGPGASSSSASSGLKIKLVKRPRVDDAASISEGHEPSPRRLSHPTEAPLRGDSSGEAAGQAKVLPVQHASTEAGLTPSSVPDEDGASRMDGPSTAPAQMPRPLKRKKPAGRVDVGDFLSNFVQTLVKKDAYGLFHAPVDEREVPGYYTVIKEPMDLKTLGERVSQGQYTTIERFRSDFLLITRNAKAFNPPGTIYHVQAQKLEDIAEKALSKQEERVRTAELEAAAREAATGPPSQDSSGSTKLSLKLGPRHSHTGKKKSKSGAKGRDLSRASSRPLVPSSLSRPPMTPVSPSRRSEYEATDEADEGGSQKQEERDVDEDGSEEGEQDFDDDDDGSRNDSIAQRSGQGTTRVKSEDLGEDGDLIEEDSADEDDVREGSRDSSALRTSQTPGPRVDQLKRKILAMRGRQFPRRNAPVSTEESEVSQILRQQKDAGEHGITIDLDEAALRARAELRRKEPARPTPYLPDGSLDVQTLHPSERAELLAPHGFGFDPRGFEPLPVESLTMPCLLSTHPLHPDAQRFLQVLTRPAPQDTLKSATNSLPLPKEASGSHYEHGMPSHYQRLPHNVPTLEIAPVYPDQDATTGIVSEKPTQLPNRWVCPSSSVLPEFEPAPHLDQLYPLVKEADATTVRNFRAKSKDQEREGFGQATLSDWTFFHARYTRCWDGVSDLAVWKDVESAAIGVGPVSAEPLRSASNGASAGPSPNATLPAHGAMFRNDGELGTFDRWEWSRMDVLRDTLLWEDRKATWNAAGVERADRNSERAMMEKLGELDGAAQVAEERRPGDGERIRAPKIPPHELASQADSSASFLQNSVWGGFEGELWASSLERFVQGAIQCVQEDEDQETEKEDPILPPSDPDALLTEAAIWDTVLDRDLYSWIRDEVVVPVTKRRFAAVVARAGDVVRQLEAGLAADFNQPDDEHAEGEVDDALMCRVGQVLGASQSSTTKHLPQSASSAHAILTRWNVSHLVLHMPLIWSRLRLVRALLDRPVQLVDGDDRPPYMITAASRAAEWAQTPPVPSDEDSRKVTKAEWRAMRLGDSEWTARRLHSALQQYAGTLVELDRRVRQPDGENKPPASPETEEMKTQLRLALLALARMAPPYSIALSV